MNYNNLLNKSNYLLILAFVIVSFLLIMLLKYEKEIEESIFKITTNNVLYITRNNALYIKDILNEHNDYIDDIKADQKLRDNLEKIIKNLTTDNIKYAYLLYKDKHDVFRFLVDGSSEDEKSYLNQKFDITNNKWFDVYTSKKPVLIQHTILHNLFITYLVPILQNGEVKLILVIDFSIKTVKEINEIIIMMKIGLILLLSTIIISLLVVLIHHIKYKKMQKLSYVDKLTSVYNRNYLDIIEDKIELDNYVIAVLDIDYFKSINDKYGHEVGDRVLKEFGEILLHTIRTNEDIVIRYGGEEFLVLIKRNSIESIVPLSVIDRISENIKNHKVYIDNETFISITVSIGVNKSPQKYKNFLDAFKVADIALYDAKNSGRDMIKISEEICHL